MGIPEQEWARERGRLFLPGMAEGRCLSALPCWASGWTTENSIRVASIRGWTVTENQVAEVEREIHPKWYGQPITREAGVEQAVRQSSTGSPGLT